MGDVYMIDGEILHGFVNHAKDQEFDNTGTGLSSTNAEDAIKEVNSNVSEIEPIYNVYIPYDSTLQDNIIGLLQKALADNKFKDDRPFLGCIEPSGHGAMFGLLYQANTAVWYGSVYVAYPTLGGLYSCENNVFRKIN